MDVERTNESRSLREREDVVSELPAGPSMEAAAAAGDAFHPHHSRTSSKQESPVDERFPGRRRGSLSSVEPTSSVAAMHPTRRRGSTASRVPIDHFDPEGVTELKRTLSRQSATRSTISMDRIRSPDDPIPPFPIPHSSAQSTSGSTAICDPGDPNSGKDFDLESHLRGVVRQ